MCRRNNLFFGYNAFGYVRPKRKKLPICHLELRKEGYIADDITVILSNLEISDKTLEKKKKINNKETIKCFFEVFDSYL